MWHLFYAFDKEEYVCPMHHRHSKRQSKEILFNKKEDAIAYALLLYKFGYYPWLYGGVYEFNFETEEFENLCY